MDFERESPKADEVHIDILYCGVCHSDLHQVKNDWGNTLYPCVPGHEIIGKVVAVGSAVTKFKAVDSVERPPSPSISCLSPFPTRSI